MLIILFSSQTSPARPAPPVLEPSSTKISYNIRMQYYNMMVKHCLTIYDECSDAWERVIFILLMEMRTYSCSSLWPWPLTRDAIFRLKRRNWPFSKNVAHPSHIKVAPCWLSIGCARNRWVRTEIPFFLSFFPRINNSMINETFSISIQFLIRCGKYQYRKVSSDFHIFSETFVTFSYFFFTCRGKVISHDVILAGKMGQQVSWSVNKKT